MVNLIICKHKQHSDRQDIDMLILSKGEGAMRLTLHVYEAPTCEKRDQITTWELPGLQIGCDAQILA